MPNSQVQLLLLVTPRQPLVAARGVTQELTPHSQMDELTQQQSLAFRQQQEKLGTQTKFMTWILQD